MNGDDAAWEAWNVAENYGLIREATFKAGYRAGRESMRAEFTRMENAWRREVEDVRAGRKA